ncbi:hypothetical protein ACFXJ8_35715 [Nonomuraea sp. NPDC059194]|uniref:hypothetical protein n=1 Tax=Nonomuraea sp. NPDC059194 TaxID=3346764 RepID=UPI0036B6635C
MEALAQVLDDLVEIVAASEQDTTWAGTWDTGDEMIRELRDHAGRLRRGDGSTLGELEFLFLPTGPLQEVSISSGWGDQFLVLAGRFDRARASARRGPGAGE